MSAQCAALLRSWLKASSDQGDEAAIAAAEIIAAVLGQPCRQIQHADGHTEKFAACFADGPVIIETSWRTKALAAATRISERSELLDLRQETGDPDFTEWAEAMRDLRTRLAQCA